MLFAMLAETSDAVAATRSRLAKVERLADCLRQLAPDEIETGAGWLVGTLRQGRIGLGPAVVRDALDVPAAGAATLTVADVDRVFEALAVVSGKGSAAERRRLLRDLFARATERE